MDPKPIQKLGAKTNSAAIRGSDAVHACSIARENNLESKWDLLVRAHGGAGGVWGRTGGGEAGGALFFARARARAFDLGGVGPHEAW